MSDTLARLTGITADDPDRAQIIIELSAAVMRGQDVTDADVRARCIIEGRYLAERKRQHEQQGTVYYLRVGQYVKIGTARDLRARLHGYPPDAELLATEPGGKAVEKQRHEQFAHLLAARREWFKPSAELMDHCDALAVSS